MVAIEGKNRLLGIKDFSRAETNKMNNGRDFQLTGHPLIG